jgi:hypothetical protein
MKSGVRFRGLVNRGTACGKLFLKYFLRPIGIFQKARLYRYKQQIMTTTKNLLLAFLSVALFAACSKDSSGEDPNPRPNPPGGNPSNPNQYTPGKTMTIDDLVLYTANGEIRDAKLLKDFMTRNFPDYIDHFSYGQTSVNDHGIFSTIEFIENNKVKLNDTIMDIVSKTDKELLLSPTDSANMPGPESTWLGHCMLLHTQVPQYNPYSICQNAGGNCKKYRKTFPVIISGKDYYLPILKYVVKSNCNIIYYNSKPMPNYFNKNILGGLLRDKDSVLVQISRVPMMK